MDPVRTLVRAMDPLTRLLLHDFLDSRPGITAVSDTDAARVDVVVLVADRLTQDQIAGLRVTDALLCVPKVLITGDVDGTDLLVAARCNVVTRLPRPAATADRLEEAVRAAAGTGGSLSAAMLTEVVSELGRLRREVVAPARQRASGLTAREVDVLRLLSEGFDTHEIAGELFLSERAVKRVINAVTGRLKLRNRPHAVAYAVREGII